MRPQRKRACLQEAAGRRPAPGASGASPRALFDESGDDLVPRDDGLVLQLLQAAPAPQVPASRSGGPRRRGGAAPCRLQREHAHMLAKTGEGKRSKGAFLAARCVVCCVVSCLHTSRPQGAGAPPRRRTSACAPPPSPGTRTPSRASARTPRPARTSAASPAHTRPCRNRYSGEHN